MNHKLVPIKETDTLATFKELKAEADGIFELLDVSQATRTDYRYRIDAFLKFIKKNGFDVNSYLSYKRLLADRNDLTVSTKNKYLSAAKVFLKELNRLGRLPVDITQNVKTFNQSKKHKKDGLNDDEVLILSEKLKNLSATPENTRLRAIFSLLALQGLRQIELIRLNVKDIDLVAQTAMVQGKGRDDKEAVSLHPETVKALKDYIELNKVRDGALLFSRSNNGKNQRLTTRSLRRLVKDVLMSLGIDKSTHGFRHYFTTKLIINYKGDLLEVAQYTRHRSLEMLQVYNDSVKKKADLPRFYDTFKEVSF